MRYVDARQQQRVRDERPRVDSEPVDAAVSSSSQRRRPTSSPKPESARTHRRHWLSCCDCNYAIFPLKQFNVPTALTKFSCATFVLLQLFSSLFTLLAPIITSTTVSDGFFYVKPKNIYDNAALNPVDRRGVHISFIQFAQAIQIPFRYHNYARLTGVLQQLHSEYASLTRLYSIGKSEQGRELWVLVISKFPNDRPLLVPAVKYVGNMHGNEAVSREIVLHFANYLLENYGKNQEITKFLDTTQIHLMPSMNPDGFEAAREGECTGVLGRYNARLIDLNRNFPDTKRHNPGPRALEVMDVMRWLDSDHFVLSANLHGGALVASYPFDNYAGFSRRSGYSLSPDDDLFRHLALTYSLNHKRMHFGRSCGETFNNGITNGAGWFPLTGGMQDYNYEHTGTLEITLEVSCCKYPLRQYLRGYYEENEHAMLSYLQEVHRGVKGMVYDAESNQSIGRARVRIVGREISFPTTNRGEYFRIVLPGIYQLEVFADGYQTTVRTVEVPANNNGAIVTNIYLARAGAPPPPSINVQQPQPVLPMPPPPQLFPPQQQSMLFEKSLLNSSDAASIANSGSNSEDAAELLMPAATPFVRPDEPMSTTTAAPSLSPRISSNAALRPIEFNERTRQLISDSVRKLIFNSVNGGADGKVQQGDEFRSLLNSGSKHPAAIVLPPTNAPTTGGSDSISQPYQIDVIQLTNADVVPHGQPSETPVDSKLTDGFVGARTAQATAVDAADFTGNIQQQQPSSLNSVETDSYAKSNTASAIAPLLTDASTTTALPTTAFIKQFFADEPPKQQSLTANDQTDKSSLVLSSEKPRSKAEVFTTPKRLIAFSFSFSTASPTTSTTVSVTTASSLLHFNVQSINNRFGKDFKILNATTTLTPPEITTTTKHQKMRIRDIAAKNQAVIVIKARKTDQPTTTSASAERRRAFQPDKTQSNSSRSAKAQENAVDNLTARDSAIPVVFMRPLTTISNNRTFAKQQPIGNTRKLLRLTNRSSNFSSNFTSGSFSTFHNSVSSTAFCGLACASVFIYCIFLSVHDFRHLVHRANNLVIGYGAHSTSGDDYPARRSNVDHLMGRFVPSTSIDPYFSPNGGKEALVNFYIG